MNNITAIIVSYDEAQLLAECMASIRKFYPTLPVVIVDGSPVHSPCYIAAASMRGAHTTVIQPGYNIGHGRGMVRGIGNCDTHYFLLVDSDVVITHGGVIEKMYNKLCAAPKAYGIGPVITVRSNGLNASTGTPYLHPHFAMVRRVAYYRHAKFIHHGAPMIRAMNDLKAKRTHYLISFDVHPYIIHRERGTRSQNPAEFHPSTWDRA